MPPPSPALTAWRELGGALSIDGVNYLAANLEDMNADQLRRLRSEIVGREDCRHTLKIINNRLKFYHSGK